MGDSVADMKYIAIVLIGFMCFNYFDKKLDNDSLVKELKEIRSERDSLKLEVKKLNKEIISIKKVSNKLTKQAEEHRTIIKKYIESSTGIKLPYKASLEEMSLVLYYSKAYEIDLKLLTAVCLVESAFDEKAVSNKGAKGIMQLTDDTAEYVANKLSIDEYDMHDPKYNIWFGSYYLKHLQIKVNRSELLKDVGTRAVLASYYSGYYRVIRHRGVPNQPLAQSNIKKYEKMDVL